MIFSASEWGERRPEEAGPTFWYMVTDPCDLTWVSYCTTNTGTLPSTKTSEV